MQHFAIKVDGSDGFGLTRPRIASWRSHRINSVRGLGSMDKSRGPFLNADSLTRMDLDL